MKYDISEISQHLQTLNHGNWSVTYVRSVYLLFALLRKPKIPTFSQNYWIVKSAILIEWKPAGNYYYMESTHKNTRILTFSLSFAYILLFMQASFLENSKTDKGINYILLWCYLTLLYFNFYLSFVLRPINNFGFL